MPLLIALLAAFVGAWIWYSRARNAAQIASELADMAGDVLGAARRFGFRRRANIHPVESVEDADLALTALAEAWLELEDLPRAEQRAALRVGIQQASSKPLDAIDEMLILGRWLVAQCKTPEAAVTRLARRLAKLDRDGLERLMPVLTRVREAGDGVASRRQQEALEEISRAFPRQGAG